MMCRTMLIASALALSSSALASDDDLPKVIYPRLSTTVRHANDFIPSGWSLVALDTGDLSGDQQPDVVVLMRMADPANIKPVMSSPDYKTDDTNPYLVAIGFARAGGFTLAASNHALFPREVAPMHGDDPPGPESVEIRQGVLTLTLRRLRGFDRLRFRWDGNAFPLIGYDCAGAAGGDFTSMSANYLTGKARIEKGDASRDHSKVTTLDIRPEKRPTLDQINWEFDWAGSDVRGASLGC